MSAGRSLTYGSDEADIHDQQVTRSIGRVSIAGAAVQSG